MSETFILTDDNNSRREFDDRSEAETVKQELEDLGAEVELTVSNGSKTADGSGTPQADVVGSDLPDEPPGLEEDPISWAPEHFVDNIQGTPAINRKGYAVMAERFDIQVVAEPITLPSETGFEYAEFRAEAVTQDGKEYSGFGSAHVDRQDGDDPYLLGELAETRALKRALAYATGVGMTAVSELKGEL